MAWPEARGARFRGAYKDGNGDRRYVPGTFPSKRAARLAAEEEEAKVRSGTWFDPTVGKMLFSTYFEEHWLPNRVGEINTLSSYESHYNAHLKEAFGHMELKKMNSAAIQRWVTKMTKEEMTPGTLVAKVKALSTILGAKKGVSAVRDGLIPTNPCIGVSLPTVVKRTPDPYDIDESDLIISRIPEWYRAIPLLDCETGNRWGELMGLQVCDFTDDYHWIRIHQTIVETATRRTGNGTRFTRKEYPKGKAPREFAIGPETATLVRTLVKQRQLFPADRLFSMPGKDGLPLRTPEWPQGIPISRAFFRQSVWIPAHEGTAVRRRRFHDLRASNISWLLAGGLDIASVMERLGHADMATTQVYVKAMKGADQRALAALEIVRKRARDA